MDLPKNEKTFQFNVVGETTEETFTGQFTVKCIPTIADRRLIELERTRLQADYVNPTDDLRALSNLLATLRVHIIDAPEWWKQSNGGLSILDLNVITELYALVLEQEKLWRKELQEKKAPKLGN